MAGHPDILRVSFASPEAFRREFESNIASGGLFIPCNRPFELRSRVAVQVALAFCGEEQVLEAEVVHCVPPELAASGATPGVAVQFIASVGEVRQRLSRYVEGTAHVPADTGRRKEPRSPARLPVTIETPDGEQVEARTRNVSRGGVLLSVPDEAVRVGDAVRVTLPHPITEEVLEVEGRVVREVADAAGGVAALGIRFEPPDAERERVETFLAEVAAAEHSRRLGGISGPIEHLGLESLVQMFAAGAPQGTLTVMRGGEEGTIGLEGGMLLGARLGATRGVKALARMLSWKQGRFEFFALVDPEEFDEPAEPLAGALLEALRVLDEAGGLEAARLEPSARFRVDDDALAIEETLSKLEVSLVDLARAGFSLRKMLDVVPEPDPVVLAALEGLMERGILEAR